MALAADPSYQAYLKALGFDEGLARSDATRRTAQINAGAELVKPEMIAQGVEQREGISDTYEDRGMYLGSERLRDIAGQRRTEAYGLATIEKQRADQLAGVDMGLAHDLSDINKTRLQAKQQYDAYVAAANASAAAAANSPYDQAINLVLLGEQTQAPNLPAGTTLRSPTSYRPVRPQP